MTTAEAINLDVLYEQDETAWLEVMAALASEGRYGEMDFPNLSEYLADMARILFGLFRVDKDII